MLVNSNIARDRMHYFKCQSARDRRRYRFQTMVGVSGSVLGRGGGVGEGAGGKRVHVNSGEQVTES